MRWKEMEEIKRFTKSTKRKFEDLETALRNISEKNNVNYNNNENSPLLLEILKNRISNFEKELTEKRCDYKFSSEAEILETERGLTLALFRNKKEKLKQNLRVRKKKSY